MIPDGRGPHVRAWTDVPEVEVAPNNFRTALASERVGINRIRWRHPTDFPSHSHDDIEQIIIVLEGEMAITIGEIDYRLHPGDVAVIPPATPHVGHSTGSDVVFLEVFSPLRIQNLAGFIGPAF